MPNALQPLVMPGPAESRMLENENLLSRALVLSGELYAELDNEGRLVRVIDRLPVRLAGLESNYLGMTPWDIGALLFPSNPSVDEWRALFERRLSFVKLRFHAPSAEDGTALDFSCSGEPVFDDIDRFCGFRIVVQEIAELAFAEQRVQTSEERFHAVFELSSDWYWEQDEQFRFIEVRGLAVKSGQHFLGKAHWDPSFNTEPVGMTWEDHHIEYLKGFDDLTLLPNRTQFGALLTATLRIAMRDSRCFALLFINIDRFKVINDTLGHVSGDMLLQTISRRLTHCLRASDILARLGGDEFVVLVQDVVKPHHIAAIARELLLVIVEPVYIADQECSVTASIGIGIYPADGRDEHALMRNAGIALHRAKAEGRNCYQFYAEHNKSEALQRLTLENSLRRALERNELLLHYQAKLDLRTNSIAGTEALLRWQHPDLGLVAPDRFIALAEETGLIVPIGRWVLQTACAQNVAWQRIGLPPITMAVNLSPRQFNDENLLSDVASVLKGTGMPPALLELELTEGMMMHNVERASEILTALNQLGTRIAIDDFGVGYSSLSQLKRFPIETLKVDRSFIRELPDNAEDRAIALTIMAMAKALGLMVVAEGVETAAQESFLREHGCDQTQGYYFSRPITADQFGELLRDHIAAPDK